MRSNCDSNGLSQFSNANTVILSFLELERERDFSSVSDRSLFAA
jgi:hypothetical protein